MAEDDNLKEYRIFVKFAAQNDSNIPIPNSDQDHAKILFEYMIPKAKKYIHIFTGSFREVFYKELRNEFIAAIERDVEICVLSCESIPKETKMEYPKILFETIETNFPNHFMVIDNKMYRFEEPHSVDEFNVEAVANFNDEETAKDLQDIFLKMQAA